MQTWKILSRNTVLTRGKYLTVEDHAVQLPDGTVIPDWSWVVLPGYVNVVAVTESGLFLCFRQTKYALAGESLAPVGGYLEPGEDPLQAAQRELLEETGYQATSWVDLGRYPVDGNRGAGTAYLFLATGARPIASPQSDDLEQQELVLLDRQQVHRAMLAGQFQVLGWVAAVALALHRLDAET
jgi:ADP-ribose pyrophosphatase